MVWSAALLGGGKIRNGCAHGGRSPSFYPSSSHILSSSPPWIFTLLLRSFLNLVASTRLLGTASRLGSWYLQPGSSTSSTFALTRTKSRAQAARRRTPLGAAPAAAPLDRRCGHPVRLRPLAAQRTHRCGCLIWLGPLAAQTSVAQLGRGRGGDGGCCAREESGRGRERDDGVAAAAQGAE